MSLFDRVARHFRGNGTPPANYLRWNTPAIPLTSITYTEVTPIVTGIVKYGGQWRLTESGSAERGVLLVAVSPQFFDRYDTALETWEGIQNELDAMDKSLRPRRRKEKTEVSE